MTEDQSQSNPDWVPSPYQATAVGITQATHDQQKPLLKMLRKLMQPRHPRTRKFVKPKTQRKTKRQNYY